VTALGAAIAFLREGGAEVRVFAGADNCVRPREPGEPCARAADDAVKLPFVIEVEGFPNLLHELAHVVLLGRVAKDHATEYAKIPFDLARAEGRRLLFDELACCVASCVFHPGDDAAAQAWLEEQIGIQGHFFGFGDDLAAFLAAVERQRRDHREELERTLARAIAGVGEALARGGAADAERRPRRTLDFDEAWRRLLGRLAR
jgi:hypothetical protein